MNRPLGVTILSILNAVGGMLLIMAGISVLVYGNVYAKMLMRFGEMAFLANYLAVAFILAGAMGIVIGFGLWIGATWAWWIYLVVLIINLISAILTLPKTIFGVIITLIVIYYLTRPHVREFFNV